MAFLDPSAKTRFINPAERGVVAAPALERAIERSNLEDIKSAVVAARVGGAPNKEQCLNVGKKIAEKAFDLSPDRTAKRVLLLSLMAQEGALTPKEKEYIFRGFMDKSRELLTDAVKAHNSRFPQDKHLSRTDFVFIKLSEQVEGSPAVKDALRAQYATYVQRQAVEQSVAAMKSDDLAKVMQRLAQLMKESGSKV